MATKKKAKKKQKYAFPMDVVRLVRKVEKKILEEPRRFDMNVVADKYAEDVVKENEDTLPPCGTVGCIAGWIGLIGLEDKVQWKKATWGQGFAHLRKPEKEVKQNLWNYARERLGIPEDFDWYDEGGCELPKKDQKVSAQSLFLDSNWPRPYCDRFFDAETPKRKAMVAVQRLEYMLRTGR